jgi:hypothetical protein
MDKRLLLASEIVRDRDIAASPRGVSNSQPFLKIFILRVV